MADNLDPELLRQLNESLLKFSETVNGVTPTLEHEAQAKKIAAEAEKNATAARNAATESLKKFSSTVLQAGGGMSKYTGAFDKAGDAALSVGKNFGLIGIAAGGLIKVFTMAAGAVFKQNDAMLKAADSLAQMGVNGGITSKEILALGQKAGYASGELEEWTNITKSLGTDITALGISATEGVKAFGELSKMDEKMLAGYRNLGVSQQQLNKNQADYIRLQVLSGQQITERSKQDGSLRKASMEYTNNLLELSAFTGMEVEEIKRKQEAARADIAISTKLAQLQDKEEALRAKGNDAAADRIKTERENMTKLQDMAVGLGMSGDELAGFNSMLATGNFNELSAGFAAGTPGILEFIDAVKKGKKEPHELAMFMAQATKQTRQNIGDSIIQNKDIAKSFAYSKEMIQLEAKMRGKNPEEIKEMLSKEAENRKKALNGEIQDDAKNARNAQETLERRARLGADAIVGVLNGPVTKAFEGLMKVMGALAKGLAHFAKWLGGPDFTDMFETTEDIAEKQHKTEIQIDAVNNGIEKANKMINDPEGYKKEAEARQKVAGEELKAKLDSFRELKKQASEEKDVKKKLILEEKAQAAGKEIALLQEKKTQADRDAQEARNRPKEVLKKEAQARLLELERKKIELTKEENKLDEAQLKKQIETGKITPEEAAAGKTRSMQVSPQMDASGRRTAASDSRLLASQAAADYKPSESLLKKLTEGGITDKRAQANVLAQIQSESGGKAKSEALNYSPEQLLRTFPKYFKDLADAKNVAAQGQEAIGNRVYGGRMGNAQDEGFKYRGRGLIQLTGRDNYVKYGKLLGIDLAGNPDLANDPDVAERIAVEYFKQAAKVKGVNLSDSKSVSRAVGHVDVGGAESSKRELLARGIETKLPSAASGARIQGPADGYMARLHGDELVIPMSGQTETIKSTPLAELMDRINKTENTTTVDSAAATAVAAAPENNNDALMALIEMLSNKLDSVIEVLETGNDTSEELLRYSRA